MGMWFGYLLKLKQTNNNYSYTLNKLKKVIENIRIPN